MKGYKETPAFYLEFTNEHFKAKFKSYCNRESIKFTAFENKEKFRVVIDRKWEEKIFQFTNNLQ